jgi:uncharacterized protein (TIGR02145 family)
VVNTPYTTVYAELWEGGCIGDRSSYTTGSIATTPYLKTISSPPNNKMAKKEPFSFAVNGDYLTESTVYTWSATPSQYATIINQGNKVALIAFDDGSVESEFDAVVSVVAANECGSGETISTATIHLENDCRPVNQPEVAQNSLKAYADYPFALKATIPAGGNPNYTVRWYKIGEKDAIAINNSNNLSFNHTETEAGSCQYYCVAWPNCGTEEANGKKSPSINVDVNVNPAKIPIASGGILRGKACFDIAETDYSGRTFAKKSDRSPHKTDFSTLAPVTYTFVANTDGGSNLRFAVIDPDSCVEMIIDGNGIPGTISNGATATISLKYKPDLNSDPKIVGHTRTQAAKVTVYAIYDNGEKDVTLSLTANIMDDICCGAWMATNVWKSFMCHNLGGNETLDPFAPNEEILGKYYQWGQKEPVFNANLSSTGKASWISDSKSISNTSWTASRGINDPCPFGWRVPTNAELTGIGTKNVNTRSYLPTDSWTAPYNKGVVLSNSMLLIGAGYVSSSTGSNTQRNNYIYYWTSSNYSTSTQYTYGWAIAIAANTHTYYDKSRAYHVRCIADE